ncbi:hypothetical protein OIU74_023194, partial [Salix koriyanagi]
MYFSLIYDYGFVFTSMVVYSFLLLVQIFVFKEQTKKKMRKETRETHHHWTLTITHEYRDTQDAQRKQLLYLKCWYHECTSRVISADFAFTLWNTSTQFSSENYQSSF